MICTESVQGLRTGLIRVPNHLPTLHEFIVPLPTPYYHILIVHVGVRCGVSRHAHNIL
jgi:hypothetical protein